MEIATQRYPAGLNQPCHGHAEAGFSIVLAGSLLERVGSTEEVAGPLSVVCKPVGTEHSNRFGPDGATLMRIALTQPEAAELVSWAGSLGSWRWTHGGAAARAFVRLASAGSSAAAPPDSLHGAAWDALAALAQEAATSPAGGGSPPRWLQSTREAIDDSADTPRVDVMAKAAQVHPVYLARQFRRFFGCSISEYVQRKRVRRSVGLIAREGSLSMASFAAGFADQPHMCRVFRRETGLTPRQYRHLLTSAVCRAGSAAPRG